MSDFIGVMLQLTVLIMIAGACNLIAPRLKVPYTVLLFLVGLALVPVTDHEHLSFLSSFTLSPDLLFYVFLPILLFESAYNMKFSEVQANRRSTWTLATVGLIISTTLIAGISYGVFLLL